MNRTTLTRSLTTRGALLTLAFALAAAPGLRAQAPPSAGAAPAGQKAGPPTETGFVVLARDSSLLISSVPMGQAFAVPGGGTFVSGAPKGDAGKKPDGGRAGEPGGTWVAAGGDAGRGTGTAACGRKRDSRSRSGPHDDGDGRPWAPRANRSSHDSSRTQPLRGLLCSRRASGSSCSSQWWTANGSRLRSRCPRRTKRTSARPGAGAWPGRRRTRSWPAQHRRR